MAFGSNSKVFTSFPTDAFNRTAAFDLNSDTFKIAQFGNSGTPDQTVASANTAFNAGQWVTGNEVIATGWPTGGLALASVTSTFSSTTYTFDAADKSGGASDTITNAYGCHIYDDTLTTPVADQGVCYLAYGGANSVVSGTFTTSFHASGIFTLAV